MSLQVVVKITLLVNHFSQNTNRKLCKRYFFLCFNLSTITYTLSAQVQPKIKWTHFLELLSNCTLLTNSSKCQSVSPYSLLLWQLTDCLNQNCIGITFELRFRSSWAQNTAQIVEYSSWHCTAARCEVFACCGVLIPHWLIYLMMKTMNY